MNNQSDKKDEGLVGPAVDSKPFTIDKTRFGALAPLTAAQVVALLIKSDIALGACACGPCGAGPCY